MAKQNITYFLGAGASCNALPTIANMSEQIRIVANLPGLTELKSFFDTLADESRRYTTVDTYARMLFLNGREQELKRLKLGLSICFFYWQYYDGKGQGNNPSPNIDYRYISLVSSFLQKKENGRLYIPENIKFITWNYDTQLELALQYFTLDGTISGGLTGIQHAYSSIPNPGNSSISSPSIIHLNGLAGIIQKENQIYNVADNILRVRIDFPYFAQIIKEYFNTLYIESSYKQYDYFSYSWEQNNTAKYSLQKAIEIIEQTNVLVIIGYSFPVFNRDIDRKLFGSRRNFKVYYQDPKANKSALSNIFDLVEEKIHEEKNCEQFFLPFEL